MSRSEELKFEYMAACSNELQDRITAKLEFALEDFSEVDHVEQQDADMIVLIVSDENVRARMTITFSIECLEIKESKY